jgi:penicillin-binding protein 2
MALLADINRQDGAPELRRRTRLLYLVLILVFGALLTRLFFLQLVDGERYTFLSENNRVRIKRIPGTRGMVFDRQGQLLVDSRPSFDLLFVAEDAEEPESTLRQLARYLRRDEKELLAIL